MLLDIARFNALMFKLISASQVMGIQYRYADSHIPVHIFYYNKGVGTSYSFYELCSDVEMVDIFEDGRVEMRKTTLDNLQEHVENMERAAKTMEEMIKSGVR